MNEREGGRPERVVLKVTSIRMLITRACELCYWQKAANEEVEGLYSNFKDDLNKGVGRCPQSMRGSLVNSMDRNTHIDSNALHYLRNDDNSLNSGVRKRG